MHRPPAVEQAEGAVHPDLGLGYGHGWTGRAPPALPAPDPRNSVVLTGYQAEGTRGRQLAEGATQVKMHGRYVPVRAEVVQLPTMSVHADAEELVAWLARMPAPPRSAYVVHGEGRSNSALARRIREDLDWCAVVPRLGERVVVG